ncbi:hypothetical protein CG709_07010 [Lachnotalea glycerini]|nr:hypothetical protein CG709_07010 [Lachnotalea glycerini]
MGLGVFVVGASFAGFRFVLIPMLYLFRAGIEDKIKFFVENGGIAVMTFWSGIVDETDACFLKGTPGNLTDVFGLRQMEMDGLYDKEENTALPIEGNSLSFKRSYTCQKLCELVKVSDAKVLMTYEKDFYKGLPVLTCNQYGKGKAYYICADMEQAFYDDLLEAIQKEANLEKPLSYIPKGVEVTTRESDEAIYLIIQNFNPDSVDMTLPLQEYTIIYGENTQKLAGFATVVLKKMKQ